MDNEKTEEEIKADLRTEMREEILKANGFENKYNIALLDRYCDLSYPEMVPLSVPRRIDNMLRNFAYEMDKYSSHRLVDFLEHYYLVRKLEKYPQRPANTDIHSVRWHYMNGKIKRRQAIRLLKQIAPMRVDPFYK